MEEEKSTAIYVMARKEELARENVDSYDILLTRQKEECLKYLRSRFKDEDIGDIEIYTRRSHLFMDIERGRIKRLVVQSLNRLGSSPEELEGILFELDAAGVELVSLT